MFNKLVYSSLKALIGNLEEKMERLDQELTTPEEEEMLAAQVEDIWGLLNRRKDERRRGPYQRRIEIKKAA